MVELEHRLRVIEMEAAGIAPAIQSAIAQLANAVECIRFAGAAGQTINDLLPRWDQERRTLYVGGYVVKQFREPAPNQEAVLAAFHQEGWTHRIDDPLPPSADQDPKYRLHHTIQRLNNHQKNHLIRFRGDGTGQGVYWELTEAVSIASPSSAIPKKPRFAA